MCTSKNLVLKKNLSTLQQDSGKIEYYVHSRLMLQRLQLSRNGSVSNKSKQSEQLQCPGPPRAVNSFHTLIHEACQCKRQSFYYSRDFWRHSETWFGWHNVWERQKPQISVSVKHQQCYNFYSGVHNLALMLIYLAQ